MKTDAWSLWSAKWKRKVEKQEVKKDLCYFCVKVQLYNGEKPGYKYENPDFLVDVCEQ